MGKKPKKSLEGPSLVPILDIMEEKEQNVI